MLECTDIITVETIGDPPSYIPKSAHLVRLKLTDNLLSVRQELEKNELILINNTLLFSRKFLENNNNSNKSYGFAEIALEKEENFLLNEIIDENILYLKQCSKINWKFLNNLRQLDYGCTMTFDGIEKANKRPFEMKDCELTEINAK